MQYYSLQHQAPHVSFREAVLKGQAPDKGLYFPRQLPTLPKDFIENLASLSKEEIGTTVMRPYVGADIPEEVLKRIISETVNFDFPLVKINDQISSLELFHGPTYAFKDVGARFMSRCLGYFHSDQSKKDHDTGRHLRRYRWCRRQRLSGRRRCGSHYPVPFWKSQSDSGITVNHLWQKYYGPGN